MCRLVRETNPWRGSSRHRQPCELTLAGGSSFFERCITAYRLGASRHRRTQALKRYASDRPSPIATSLSASRKPPRRTAVLRTLLSCFANSHAPTFGSEWITAFFRHHGPVGLGNLPSRQYALVQKRPQTALRDIDAAWFLHLLHLSHCHPLGLLFATNRFRKRSSTCVRLSFCGSSFVISPSMASKSISASLKRFADIFRLAPPFQVS